MLRVRRECEPSPHSGPMSSPSSSLPCRTSSLWEVGKVLPECLEVQSLPLRVFAWHKTKSVGSLGYRNYFAENNYISPKQTEQVEVRNQSPGEFCRRDACWTHVFTSTPGRSYRSLTAPSPGTWTKPGLGKIRTLFLANVYTVPGVKSDKRDPCSLLMDREGSCPCILIGIDGGGGGQQGGV